MIDDGFEHNPGISRQALAVLHEGAYGWALSLTGYDRQAAEDVMHDAYLALLDGSARYNGRSSLKTWLYGVIRNCMRRHVRSRHLERARTEQYGKSALHDSIEDGSHSISDRPSAAIRHAIWNLPLRQREVLELVIDAEFTVEQAATVLGISVGSARTHYHRAKQALRRQLEDNHERS